MQNSTEVPSFSARLAGTIDIPRLDREPGPLHTILRDESNNLYYTDEINHSLVSLNSTGEIRWHRSKQGKGSAEFNYPKGLDLGWIEIQGTRTKCLAVCDSWNHRIQFFNPEGSYLTSWDKIGKESLKDVVDIRFIGAADGSGSGLSYWLFLDRGHHSLFGVDISGNLISRVGRAFPDNLESRWSIPSDSTQLQVSPFGLFQKCLPYDPIFMPARIFGSTQEALFVWEPKSRRLKHAALGNVLPVWINPPRGAEWIGADEDRLLCFDSSTVSIASYDIGTKTWQLAKIQGTPVPSGRSTEELWSQEGLRLRHWICRNERGPARSWMLCGLRDEIAAIMHSGVVPEDREQLQEAVAHLQDLSYEALGIPADRWSDSAFLERKKSDLSGSMHAFSAALSHLRGFSLATFQALLRLRILQTIYSSVEYRNYFQPAADLVKTALAPVAGLFDETLLFRDEWFLSWQAKTYPGDADSAGFRESILQGYYDTLMNAVKELARWLWSIPLSDAISAAPSKPAMPCPKETCPGHSRKSVGSFFSTPMAASQYLREIDRIFVGDPAYAGHVSPAAICYAPGLGFLVTLNNSGVILRLSECGQVLGPIMRTPADSNLGQPLGIAVDDAGRIWISRPQAKCIEIFNAGTNQRQSLEDLVGMPLGLRYPTGLCRVSGGQILIADTQNSRIIAAASNGRVTTLVDRRGKHPGELQHPIAFCSTHGTSEFLVVEIRNHRLQRFGMDGQSIGQFGGAGLGKGKFVLPESVATFNDGILAISQRACTRALKLFANDGDELETLYVDYSPWGLLVHKSLLLVCEAFGDHIRVYERV